MLIVPVKVPECDANAGRVLWSTMLIKREAAGRAFEASCTPVDGQVFNNVTLVRTRRPSDPGERAMDDVAVVESQ